jgi:hypothetical protein
VVQDEKKPATPVDPKADPAAMSEKFSKFFETDDEEVKSLISGARKIRMAMGKGDIDIQAIESQIPVNIAPDTTGKNENRAVIQAGDIKVEAASPVYENTEKKLEIKNKPKINHNLDDNERNVAREIEEFVKRQKEPTSIDIMDFTRDLKHKGYYFKDNIVLEKIYLGIEQQKKEEKQLVLEAVCKFLDSNDDPDIDDMESFIDKLKHDGIKYDRYEIRRMISREKSRRQ